LYRAWATAADALPEDLEGAWKDADAAHGRCVKRFAEGVETLEGLYRRSLRASMDAIPTTVAEAHAEHAYRLVRRHLAAGAGSPADAGLVSLASGPCEGMQRGDPEKADGTVMLSGASGILVRASVKRGEGGGLTAAAVSGTTRSFRPYAPGLEDLGLLGKPETAEGKCLVAFSRMHLQRSVENARAFVAAWAALEGAPAVEQRKAFAGTLARAHGWAESTTELEKAAAGN
ncbi:MAG: hypothetical protein ACYTDX_09760, partial [Planctomycetota bacterium]